MPPQALADLAKHRAIARAVEEFDGVVRGVEVLRYFFDACLQCPVKTQAIPDARRFGK
jgi:hypothetical protein